MKKLSILALIILALSCKSNLTLQERAEITVKKYLDSTMNDPSSYERIKFSALDSTKDTFFADKEYLKLEAQWKRLDTLKEVASGKAYLAFSVEENEILAKQENIKRTHKPKFVGYRIEHNYREKNQTGALVMVSKNFYLDSLLTKVTGTRANEH